MSHMYQKSIIGIGDAKGITLPKAWLDYYETRIGDKIKMITNGRKATIELISTEQNKDFDESNKDKGENGDVIEGLGIKKEL